MKDFFNSIHSNMLKGSYYLVYATLWGIKSVMGLSPLYPIFLFYDHFIVGNYVTPIELFLSIPISIVVFYFAIVLDSVTRKMKKSDILN